MIINEMDDLARFHAYEHMLCTVAAMWSINFADALGGKPSDAAIQLRDALVGSLQDSRERPPELRKMIQQHLDRLMQHTLSIAKAADGTKKTKS